MTRSTWIRVALSLVALASSGCGKRKQESVCVMLCAPREEPAPKAAPPSSVTTSPSISIQDSFKVCLPSLPAEESNQADKCVKSIVSAIKDEGCQLRSVILARQRCCNDAPAVQNFANVIKLVLAFSSTLREESRKRLSSYEIDGKVERLCGTVDTLVLQIKNLQILAKPKDGPITDGTIIARFDRVDRELSSIHERLDIPSKLLLILKGSEPLIENLVVVIAMLAVLLIFIRQTR